jgi:hypothetical protein
VAGAPALQPPLYASATTVEVSATTTAVPTLALDNKPHTVVGGRKVRCSKPATGCEAIWAITQAGARVAFTVTYPDHSRQVFTETSNSLGQTPAHLISVAYLPPAGSRHDSPTTIAYVAASAQLANGSMVKAKVLRFAVMRS